MKLPVALHSPLSVLKEQLASITAISVQEQVLILCDLSDKDRNNDRLLHEDICLRECGIEDGSFLTLHSLGMDRDRKNQITAEALRKLQEKKVVDTRIQTVSTPITAAQANHSYNGIVFDVESAGPFEINVLSVSLAGMLGRIRVFARNTRWNAGPTNTDRAHWWAHQSSLSTVGWELVADQVCRPSWDNPIEIVFQKPLTVLPHERKALYCHSGLPDDLGIQYQSYERNDIIASDDKIILHPGLGHTGSVPFDDVDGWYRSYRGLAGALSYTCTIKGWSPFDHEIYTPELKTGVKTMLLCRQSSISSSLSRQSSVNSSIDSEGESLEIDVQPQPIVHTLPLHVLYYIMEFMNWDWFENLREKVEEQEDEEEESDERAAFRNGRMTAAQYIYRAYLEQLLGQPIGGQNMELIYNDDDDDDYGDDDFSDDTGDGTEEDEDNENGEDGRDETWHDSEDTRASLISAVENYTRQSSDDADMEEGEEVNNID